MLEEVIAAKLQDPEDVVLARDILGTTDPATIAAQVHAFVPGVTGCAAFIQSVGAVFVLDLGGERVVLKVHRFGTRLRDLVRFDELEAVYAAQAVLAGQGVACPRVIAPPRVFTPERAGALMSYVEAGTIDDPRAAERARLDAGAIYALAYSSRCEHGHSGEGRMCAELRAAPDAYFSG